MSSYSVCPMLKIILQQQHDCQRYNCIMFAKFLHRFNLNTAMSRNVDFFLDNILKFFEILLLMKFCKVI